MEKRTIEEYETLLQTQWNYRPSRASDTARKLLGMRQDLLDSFESYLKSGVFPEEPVIFGLTPLEISKHYSFKPPAVFLSLDWIQRDPSSALEALVEEFHKPLPPSFDNTSLHRCLEEMRKKE